MSLDVIGCHWMSLVIIQVFYTSLSGTAPCCVPAARLLARACPRYMSLSPCQIPNNAHDMNPQDVLQGLLSRHQLSISWYFLHVDIFRCQCDSVTTSHLETLSFLIGDEAQSCWVDAGDKASPKIWIKQGKPQSEHNHITMFYSDHMSHCQQCMIAVVTIDLMYSSPNDLWGMQQRWLWEVSPSWLPSQATRCRRCGDPNLSNMIHTSWFGSEYETHMFQVLNPSRYPKRSWNSFRPSVHICSHGTGFFWLTFSHKSHVFFVSSGNMWSDLTPYQWAQDVQAFAASTDPVGSDASSLSLMRAVSLCDFFGFSACALWGWQIHERLISQVRGATCHVLTAVLGQLLPGRFGSARPWRNTKRVSPKRRPRWRHLQSHGNLGRRLFLLSKLIFMNGDVSTDHEVSGMVHCHFFWCFLQILSQEVATPEPKEKVKEVVYKGKPGSPAFQMVIPCVSYTCHVCILCIAMLIDVGSRCTFAGDPKEISHLKQVTQRQQALKEHWKTWDLRLVKQ